MKILLLGPAREEIISFLESFEDEVIATEDPINGNSSLLEDVDFIISYGYRHIIKNDVLDRFLNRAINLHISLLPWNRGADPNLWSFLEDTPKGVTIHYLDSGIDTGDILAQQKVDYQDNDTLKTSYNRLSETIEALFKQVWPLIRVGKKGARPQSEGGSYHEVRDKFKFEHLLTHGWDTPVIGLIGKALNTE